MLGDCSTAAWKAVYQLTLVGFAKATYPHDDNRSDSACLGFKVASHTRRTIIVDIAAADG